ncbi:hypothetical protein FEK33_03635 [Nocardia asteroides NBRC 15531]|uniref:Uncharacterized protein n=1 Tax=Nocardia asteroides NBRC 15531 TaxID=1110697 RepID=U5EE04_NOCAS|nr:hypothetical protein [Nocardia asteroides]TLF69397.1 hypothetical protein FEK33_03635 [Nocardia asteroides NBRC 15531]UGT48894.1 hypothetical protein LT345_31480 [Nocardia asteroides]SFL74113.1 hypothetical protein SAMN05444423_101737 [Nocardia asteroides]VEG31337.1 Uncharacterised protein [Nocardia asteroides]GAD83439.1 hypothetical protein NCAST_20_00040 [Nocardia asteroides NBRC 15531]
MTTFLALAVAAAFGYAVYHFAPKRGELPFWPFQYLPHDRAFGTYDEQRLYRDLDAVRAHAAETEEATAGATSPVQLPVTGPLQSSSRGPLAA